MSIMVEIEKEVGWLSYKYMVPRTGLSDNGVKFIDGLKNFVRVITFHPMPHLCARQRTFKETLLSLVLTTHINGHIISCDQLLPELVSISDSALFNHLCSFPNYFDYAFIYFLCLLHLCSLLAI